MAAENPDNFIHKRPLIGADPAPRLHTNPKMEVGDRAKEAAQFHLGGLVRPPPRAAARFTRRRAFYAPRRPRINGSTRYV